MVCRVSAILIVCWFINQASTSTSTSPIFDPFNTAQEENFDPARADPRGNITCLGDAYELTLPTWDGFNPNDLSMQKLCAKTQYGGAPPGQNVGAFCYYINNTPSYPRVMFDPSPEAQATSHFANPRVLLGCAYRCFCNYGVENPKIQPIKNPAIHDYLIASNETYLLQIDVNDETEPPFYRKQGPFGRHRVKTLGLDSRPERRNVAIGPLYFTEISLDPGNLIECYGDLPSFDIPPPLSRQDFRTVQQLCAVQHSFGHPDANVGGYCHRSVTPQGPKNTVWFSDEMTPRHDWTWTGGNLGFVASLRWHCSRVCSCWENPHHDNMTTDMWQILEGLSILEQDKSLYLISKSTDRRINILPEQNGNHAPSGTCGTNGRQFCPLNWDYKAWGPAPETPPGASDIIKPQTPSTNLTVCGNKCHQPSDCGSTSDKYSCSCAIPTITDIRTLGLDPVAPVAICIALFASSMKMSTFNGRDVPSYTDYYQMPHTCKCNATYTSDECCVSNVRDSSNVKTTKLGINDVLRTSRNDPKVRRPIISQNRLR